MGKLCYNSTYEQKYNWKDFTIETFLTNKNTGYYNY